MTLLTNTAYRFSLYKNLMSTNKPEMEVDINQLYEIIKYGYVKDVIEKLRKPLEKKTYNNIKKGSLSAVTLSGVFNERKRVGLQQHSGLIQIDLDKVVNYDHLFSCICKDNYTYMAFKSPGGKGIKIIVKINPSEETHLSQFWALQKYYKDYFQIELDPSCKDVSRAMLLSYDPNIYCNPASDVFEVLGEEPSKKSTRLKKNSAEIQKQIPYAHDNENLVANLAKELVKNKIDITNTYDKWWRVGLSIANTLGEQGRNYFHEISSVYTEYDPREADRFYDHILEKNKGLITLGTLVHFAKEEGIYIHRGITDQQEIPKITVKRDLYSDLKKMRLEMARAEKKPAFVIFSNKVLDQLVKNVPKTKNELIRINGISKLKVKEFGDSILKVINKK
ncbi:BT4734/BF3469 family protein [Namhaeicola litoreus]|uniref:BT4734/BF3469 family protein n=1 Tax=Namhaeicola litoreus TaxID=1052145 RepID=A0ABW3Y082_9FLAO